MVMVMVELQKWKRSKMVWGILALTLLLGIFAIDRACSISRNSTMMDSFGDLYTLAFKNLTSMFLPIVLGMFSTTLFFDEQKNDTLKSLLIIPVSKLKLYITKVAVVILMSLGLCLLIFVFCVAGALIAGDFPDFNVETLLEALFLFCTGGVLIPIAMLPIVFLATVSKGYTLPIAAILIYLAAVVVAPAQLMGIHPLASVMGIYPHISFPAMEMVSSWTGGGTITASPSFCLSSLILIGAFFVMVSIISLKKKSY